jgi:hypothetical protein
MVKEERVEEEKKSQKSKKKCYKVSEYAVKRRR